MTQLKFRAADGLARRLYAAGSRLSLTGVDFGLHDIVAINRAFGGAGVTVQTRADLRAALVAAQTADTFTVIAAIIERGAYDGRI